MPKISIVVPIYNTEKYIEKCLNSLVKQTLKEIEIICVNDASQDNSMIQVRTFANRDSRIKIIEQKHLMQGAARNNGILNATGEYIGFVDSDDWVDLDYFEKLYNAAKKYDSDIALATNIRVGKKIQKKRLNILDEKFYTSLEDKYSICNQLKNECPTNKIYRASFLNKNNIKWPEGVYCEDKLYTAQAVYYANGVVSVPNVNYYYYRNPTSTVNTKTKQHFKQLLKDKNNAKKSVVEFLREQGATCFDKRYWYIKNNTPSKFILTIKESISTQKFYLLSIIPVGEKKI